MQHSQEEKIIKTFLEKGTERGYGDLSGMVDVIGDTIKQTEERKNREFEYSVKSSKEKHMVGVKALRDIFGNDHKLSEITNSIEQLINQLTDDILSAIKQKK